MRRHHREQLRRDIERTREQITESALALRQEMAARADWREWVRARPWLFITGLLALGFLWGSRRR